MKKRGRGTRNKLEIRRFSQRPKAEEFERRAILKQRLEEVDQKIQMELQGRVCRKLGQRPTGAELGA